MSLTLTPQLLFILLGTTCLFVALASSKDKPLEIYVLKVPGMERGNRIAVAILGFILILFPFIPPLRNLISPSDTPTPVVNQATTIPSPQPATAPVQPTQVSAQSTII